MSLQTNVRKVFIFWVLVTLSSLSMADCTQSMHVIGNHAPPYRIVSEGDFSGAYFDLIKEIAKTLGTELHIEEQPFKRALLSMAAGKADLILGPNKNPERETYLLYTDAVLGSSSKAFYFASPSLRIDRYEDLYGLDLLVGRGSMYFKRFDEDTRLKKIDVTSYEQGIKMVMLGRADAVIIPEAEGDYLLRTLGIELRKSELVIPGKESYIAISKKSGCISRAKEIERAVQQLKNNGTFDQIWARYKLI